jgi:hypothetical protein
MRGQFISPYGGKTMAEEKKAPNKKDRAEKERCPVCGVPLLEVETASGEGGWQCPNEGCAYFTS